MKRITNTFAPFLIALTGLGLMCTGCQQETPATPAEVAKKQPSPEESFEQIARLFTQSVQTGAGGMNAGFIVREEDGHSRLAVKNEVTHEFIPPSKEGEPFRGVITVTSQRDYALQRIGGSGASDKSADDNIESGRSASGGGVDIFDDDLVSAPSNTRRSVSDARPSEEVDVIARRTFEDERSYELEFENNRWVLKTQLDPDTEKSIAFAFNHVLSMQP